MTKEEGVKEDRDENDIKLACHEIGAYFRIWVNKKYLVDKCVSSFSLQAFRN
jgi:hypothetical protein